MCISTETLWRSCKPYTDWNDADFVLHPTLVNDHYVTINDGLVLAVHKDSVLGDFHCLNQHGLPADIAEDIDYLLATKGYVEDTHIRVDSYRFQPPPMIQCECGTGTHMTWGDDEVTEVCHLCLGTRERAVSGNHPIHLVRLSDTSYVTAAHYGLLAEVFSQRSPAMVTAFITVLPDDSHIFMADGMIAELKPVRRSPKAQAPDKYWDSMQGCFIVGDNGNAGLLWGSIRIK